MSFESGRLEMGDRSLVVTVEEAAVLLGISRSLAYELVRQGEIPSIRLGRRLVIPRQRLLAFIEGEEVAAGDRVGGA